MEREVEYYFNWILNRVSIRGLELLVWMYNADILCAPCRLALEAVEEFAND